MAANTTASDEMMATVPPGRPFNPWQRSIHARFAWAGLFSVACHVLVGALVVGIVVRTPTLVPPIRVSLYDPPPPPPAASSGAGVVQPPAPVVPAAVTTQPTHPVHQPMHRRRPARHPAPAPAPAPNPEPVQSAAPAAEPGGVPGGTAGGIAGGTVGGTGRSLIPAGEAALQPIALTKVLPEYPPLARLRGIQGQVVLDAILDPNGRVEPEIAVVHSIPLLDAAAIAALRQWRFRPARDRNGTALRVTLRVPVRFVLR